jgi:hypothetical protein
MRFYIFRPFLRVFMGLWLAIQITTGLAAAETAHGTLLVSMTVLPSCQINANSGVTVRGATVACPVNYPFRASLVYGTAPPGISNAVQTSGAETSLDASDGDAGRTSVATTSISHSSDDVGVVFSGESRVDLSRLSGLADHGMPIGVKMLTIYY